MDALDRLAEPGLDLLARVDALLATGAPEGHRLWPLLRRMQVLPGAAVREFLDLHPAPLADAGHAVRRLIRGYDDACTMLADPVAWSGPAASAYDEARTTLLRHLDEGPESLVGRLESTAGYADALADWVEGSRLALARALADVLRSAEAVTVHAATRVGGDDRAGALAAAEIATRVLGALGVAYDGAETLQRQWAPSLAEATWRERPTGVRAANSTMRIG
ncbi:hypothetical protein [Micromonospora eburnea]|uniref:Uncharacterized protein n=1 Tax=Micromonospora eburnea TaxID=227316 RepID=A0A1C6TRW3_9ACTN|nr:hypothetical protein [Micromonospora eburnea]SCL44408.1 hypothetical protein GA0070604_0376 [Micromonospora eburnea]